MNFLFACYVPAIHFPKETVLTASEQVNINHNFEVNRLREDLLAHVLFSGLCSKGACAPQATKFYLWATGKAIEI